MISSLSRGTVLLTLLMLASACGELSSWPGGWFEVQISAWPHRPQVGYAPINVTVRGCDTFQVSAGGRIFELLPAPPLLGLPSTSLSNSWTAQFPLTLINSRTCDSEPFRQRTRIDVICRDDNRRRSFDDVEVGYVAADQVLTQAPGLTSLFTGSGPADAEDNGKPIIATTRTALLQLGLTDAKPLEQQLGAVAGTERALTATRGELAYVWLPCEACGATAGTFLRLEHRVGWELRAKLAHAARPLSMTIDAQGTLHALAFTSAGTSWLHLAGSLLSPPTQEELPALSVTSHAEGDGVFLRGSLNSPELSLVDKANVARGVFTLPRGNFPDALSLSPDARHAAVIAGGMLSAGSLELGKLETTASDVAREHSATEIHFAWTAQRLILWAGDQVELFTRDFPIRLVASYRLPRWTDLPANIRALKALPHRFAVMTETGVLAYDEEGTLIGGSDPLACAPSPLGLLTWAREDQLIFEADGKLLRLGVGDEK